LLNYLEENEILAEISLGNFEFRRHTSWLDEGYRELAEPRKQARPAAVHCDTLNIIGREAAINFRIKRLT
jgi:hypothetical protein